MSTSDREKKLEAALRDLTRLISDYRTLFNADEVNMMAYLRNAEEALADEDAGGVDKPKTICHAEGDRCHGCAHYWGKASVCEFADEVPPQQRDALEAWNPIQTAPEDTRVLLKSGLDNPPVVGAVKHREDGTLCRVLHYNGNVLVPIFRATHWRPLTAPPTVPESIWRLPDKWRAVLGQPLPYGPGRALSDCADQLERAIAQHSEPGRMAEDEAVQRMTAAMREADVTFGRVGGSTRHYVRDCLLPILSEHGLSLAAAPAPDADEREKDDETA